MTKPSSRRQLAENLSGVPRATGIVVVLLAVHLALSPIVFWRGAFEPFESVKSALLALVAILVAASWFTQILTIRLARDLASWGAILFIGSASISTAQSMSWRTSLWGDSESRFGLFAITSLGILFFATRAVCRLESQWRRLLDAVPIAAGIVGGYALLQWASCDPFSWAETTTIGGKERPFGTLGHANVLGAYLAMGVPLILTQLRTSCNERRWRFAAGYMFITMIAIAAIFVAMSRAAWLALAIGVAVWILGQGFNRKKIILIGLIGFGVFVIAVVLGAVFVEPFAERLRHLFDPSGRLDIWKAAWAIFAERPFFGCGPDTFATAFEPHRTAAFWAIEWGTTPTRAHNDLLHLLATQGALGVIAAGVFVVGLIRRGRELWRSAPDRGLLVAAISGLAAFFVQGLFGFTTIAIAALAVTFGAVLASDRQTVSTGMPRIWNGPRRLVHTAVWIAAAAIIWIAVISPLAASLACRDGMEQLAGNPSEALKSFDTAAAWEPGCERWWTKRGEAELRSGRLQNACDSFETAVHLAPASGYVWHNLAQGRAERVVKDPSVSPESAFAAFDEALRIDPCEVSFSLDAARFALQSRNGSRAKRYIDDGLSAYPDFAPLAAERAFLALLENRPYDAIRGFDIALGLDWHGDAESERRAKQVREIVISRLRGNASAKPQAAR